MRDNRQLLEHIAVATLLYILNYIILISLCQAFTEIF